MWLDTMDVHLVYCINVVDVHAWSDFSCKADLMITLTTVGIKALAAHTWAVSMEVKNVVSNGHDH